ncbi:MAG: DUF493 family protein [Lacinutrix sp.]|uniref:DUF493 family protein n=1 Tax=Lacinutrix sp. TaxID=1937692 RepID=UPI00309AFA74
MSKEQNQEEFYTKLKEQLLDTTLWPSEYLYKFIVKTNADKIESIEAIFNHLGAVIVNKESSNAKYTSISINVRLKNPDAVIAKYIEVSEKIDGVISL